MKQIELKDKRKKREKHFSQADGTIIAEVYDEDIHYLKNGKYEEIDNTLIKENDRYMNKCNSYKASFFNNKNRLMKIELNDIYIDFNIINSNSVDPLIINGKNKLYSKIIYEDIIEDIDLEYKLYPNKVKEKVVIKNGNAIHRNIVFKIITNAKLELIDSTRILVYKNNKTIFEFETPFMIDSNNIKTNNVSYRLESKNDFYLLSIEIDKDWLTEPNRAFPIVIDPTITNYGNNNNVYDTYISSYEPNTNKGNSDVLKVGVEKVNNQIRKYRTILKFELPEIGTGSQIIDAVLELVGYPVQSNISDLKTINVYKINEDWTESGANWNNMNNNYDSRVEGCFKSWPSIIYSSGITWGHSSCNITNLVQRWYTDTPNYGIMLKMNEEVYTNDLIPCFYSKNNNVSGDNPKPILKITYRNQNGIEDYMKYSVNSLSQGAIYHNLYNGNLTTIFDIGEIIGSNLPVDIDIAYNTNDVVLDTDYGYGLGMKLNLSQTIEEEIIDNVSYLKYIDEDGTTHYLIQDGNSYIDEDGIGIEAITDVNECLITDKSGNKKKFSYINNITSAKYLTEYSDIEGNEVNIIYNNDNKITQIIDSNNSAINITYIEDQVIVESPYQTVYLNYNNNKLISINTETGTTYLEYQNNLLSKIIDESGLKYRFEYYNYLPYKLKKVEEGSLINTIGNSIEAIYGLNYTKIIDEKNNISLITFNSKGNPVSTIDYAENNSLNGAYACKEFFGNYSGEQNKLVSSYELSRHTHNFLYNSNFEENNILFTSNTCDISLTDETSYSGCKSLKIVSDIANGKSVQSVVVPEGHYYTFSCYVKNTSSLKISLSYINENNQLVEEESKVILANNEFTRENVSILYSENAMSDLQINLINITSGTTYIDNVQLEEGEVVNNYNYVENSNFSDGLGNWELNAYYNGNIYSTSGLFEIVNINGVNALKVKMNPKLNTSIGKTFKLSGVAGELYTISFWYKNNGVKAVDPMFETNVAYIKFNYGTGYVGGHYLDVTPLNSDCNEWQYFCQTYASEANFSELEIRIEQRLNANDFYITNISVNKDLRVLNYNYDENGNIISIKGSNNQSGSYTYDNNNCLIKETSPIGKNSFYEYDTSQKDILLSAVSETGICNEYSYDDNGNMITSRICNYGQNEEIDTGIYRIRLKGTNMYIKNINNIINISNEKHKHNLWRVEKINDMFKIRHEIVSNRYLYLSNNTIVLNEDDGINTLFNIKRNDNGSYSIGDNNLNHYISSENGKLIMKPLIEDDSFQFFFEKVDYSYFMEANGEYTENGKYIKKVTNPLLAIKNIENNETTGNVVSVTNYAGIMETYQYNQDGYVSQITCNERSVQYNYDSNNIYEITINGQTYSILYDEFLNQKGIKLNNQLQLSNSVYDTNNGNLLYIEYNNGNRINYVYDKFDRTISAQTMDNTYNYIYDNNGNLAKISSNNGIEECIFDITKRIRKYNYNDFVINYSYNDNNNIVKRDYQIDNNYNSIENIYYNDSLISSIIFDNNSINYIYDPLGRLISKSINNVFNTEYQYNRKGYRTSVLPIQFSNEYVNSKYKYDKLNNIKYYYENDTLKKEYSYDLYSQLIEEKDYLNNLLIKYCYDSNGNISKVTKYKLDDYSFLCSDIYEYSNNIWLDQLSKFNNANIIYDQNGNVVSYDDKIFTWINGNELSRYQDSEYNIQYSYNQNGDRVYKIVNNKRTDYYLESGNIVYEKDDNNLIYYLRDEHDELIGLCLNGIYYYYLKNLKNDIIGILDNDFNKVASYEYDSWGNIISIKDINDIEITNDSHIAIINPYRYRSYYYDVETNLYYLGSRYYNPKFRRFISADEFVSTGEGITGYNMYSYAGNNPINNVDIDGRGWLKSIIQIASALSFAVRTAKAIHSAPKKKQTKKKKKHQYVFEIGVGFGNGGGINLDIGKGTKNTVKKPKKVSTKAKGISKGIKKIFNKGIKNITKKSLKNTIKKTVTKIGTKAMKEFAEPGEVSGGNYKYINYAWRGNGLEKEFVDYKGLGISMVEYGKYTTYNLKTHQGSSGGGFYVTPSDFITAELAENDLFAGLSYDNFLGPVGIHLKIGRINYH